MKDLDLRLVEKIIIRFFTTFFIVSGNAVITSDTLYSNLEYVRDYSSFSFLIDILYIFIIISLIIYTLNNTKLKNIDILLLAVSSLYFVETICIKDINVYSASVAVVFILIIFKYIFARFPVYICKNRFFENKSKWFIFFVIFVAVLHVASLVVFRYFLFRTANFDFGIFAQMFHYMKTTGLPYTTCERNTMLSHFSIHFSPIFYFILPVYMIFSHPVTLIVVQLLALYSGVIPVYLICKNRGFGKYMSAAMSAVYALYPTFRAGLFYDFHENKFLPELIMWLIYFMEKKTDKKYRMAGISVFAMMILMVKEDSAIYLACIALFWFIHRRSKKDKIISLIMLIVSIVYFFIVFSALKKYGFGDTVTGLGRYDNMMYKEQDSLADMMFNILKDPGYVVQTLLNTEKLEFVLWTFLPVLFVPFMLKKAEYFILLIPYMVINLLTDYGYQYNIGYQYAYGSGALLLYMVILWMGNGKGLRKRKMMLFICASSLIMSSASISSKNIYYTDLDTFYEIYDDITSALEKIPDDASIKSSTWFTAAMYNKKYVYHEDADIKTDYIVYDIRSDSAKDDIMPQLESDLQNGYEIFFEKEKRIIIMKKTD